MLLLNPSVRRGSRFSTMRPKRSKGPAMTSRNRKSRALASQFTELGFAVPHVLAHRITRMVLAGSSPSARDRREFQRMSAEKVAAFCESWNAMLVEIMRANAELSLLSTRWFLTGLPATRQSSRVAAAHIQRAALGILGKGVAPVRRRAVANARRLGRAR
jgi:hypothetical protein